MYRKPICLISFVLLLSAAVSVAQASVAYSPPPGGWAYIHTGGGDDGTWDHDNGSDEWDGTAIGAGNPGGVSFLLDGDANYVRIQETGDPRDYGMPDPSNRKIYFTHALTQDIEATVADAILSSVGITLSFRARIATTPPLDDQHPDGGSGIVPWPAGGDGYGTFAEGKGNFGIYQAAGGDQSIAFCLVLASEENSNINSYTSGRQGLQMNPENGTSPSNGVDAEDNEGNVKHVLELDPTQWHEFWITIEPDTSGGGTHLVKVYRDGSLVADEFDVTAGTGDDDIAFSYIFMGMGSTVQSGAYDVDFFAYKEGIELPVPGTIAIASKPTPADGAEDVSIDTILTWTRGDGAKWDKVYFGTDPCDMYLPLVGTIQSVFPAEYDPRDPDPGTEPNLLPSTTYYWYITEVNAPNEYKGDLWSFSTIPGEAQYDSPVNGALIPGVPYAPDPTILYTDLSFVPGPTAIKHTGYFSEVRDEVVTRAEDANLGPPPYSHPLSAFHDEVTYYAGIPLSYWEMVRDYYDPYVIIPTAGLESLERGKVYYWTVDETDPFGNVYQGDVWEFAVQDYYAFIPSPPNEAIFINTDVLLSWLEGYGAQNHDVFIGTSWEDVNNAYFHFSTPSDEYEFTTGTGINYYQMNGLDPETRYYWRIDEVQGRFPPSVGTIYKGPIWEFTTRSATPGLTGEYYHHSGGASPAGFESKVLVRIDPNINFGWGNGSPGPGVNPDDFSVRWSGQIAVPARGETYTFTTATDDGVRLWVNGQLVIDQWIDQGTTAASGDIELDDFGPYDIEMEYYENGGGAVARLYWESLSTAYGIIPENFLAPNLEALTPYGPYPADGSLLLELEPILSWGPALFAATHNLYFSTDFDEVSERSVAEIPLTDPCYHYPTALEAEQTYYWAVDGVNTLHGNSPWEGDVWSFRTAPYIPPNDDPNLIGWWKFDEDVGTIPIALDWSGHENHGTLNGGPERVPAGVVDDAMDFDGISQYVEVPHSASLGLTKNFTIATWIRPDVVTGGRGIVTKCEGTSHKQYVFTIANGELRLEYELSGNNYSLTGGTVIAGEWQHVAVTVDSSLLVNLYINVSSVASETAEGEVLSQTNPVVIGRWSGTYNSNYFDGLIDDVRIYNKSLSAAEIISAMAPPEAWMPYPANGATNVEDRNPILSWSPGRYVQKDYGHKLYFSSRFEDVCDRSPAAYIDTLTEPNYPYPPPSLLLDRTYYWAVDEVNSLGPAPYEWEGRVWSFTTAPCISLDNMEDYNDRGEIRGVWTDGYSSVGWGGVYPFKYSLNTASSGSNLNVSTEVDSPYGGGATGPIHGGSQSMVLLYDNDGVTDSRLPGEEQWAYNSANFSEIEANTVENLGAGQNWFGEGAKSLTMWFQGHPISDGSSEFGSWPEFSITGRGRDIQGGHDEFYFLALYPWEAEPLSTTTHIRTRVVRMDDTNPWAKAGLMIREKLTPYSKYAAVFITPNNGITFQWRDAEGGSTGTATETARTAPQYLKLERQSIGAFVASYSSTGASWDWADVNVSEDPDVTFVSVPMDDPCLYAGAAVTSHDGAQLCTADFNNWDAYPWPSTWVWGNVGLNDPERLYVALEDTVGNISVVEHDDVNAATLDSWQEWNIKLTDFTTVNLNAVKKVRIGLGDRDIQPAGGSGAIYIDDVRACPPRCVPQYGKPIGDIAQPYDCIVDEKDLRVLAGAWLLRDDLIMTVAPGDANLVAYWPLDTDFLDYSGNNFHADSNGGAVLVTDASRVKVLRLYSDGDFVNCGNPTDPCALDFGTGNWTVSAWVKTTMLGGGGDQDKGVIYGKGGDQAGGHRYGLYVNENQGTQGRVTLITDDNADKVMIDGSVINDGDWHHVAGLRDVNDLRLYIDGLTDDDWVESLPAGYDLSGTHQHNAYIGAITAHEDDPNGGVIYKYLQGSVDDVRIYDYALSPEEVAYLAVDGEAGLHLPIPSAANVYNKEPEGSQWINLKDYALITGSWLEEILWPTEE